jgi:hypothetical protein
MPQGYIHIGPVKTGTTFLQKTVFENRRVLERFGLGYPFTDRLDFERYANAGILVDTIADVKPIRSELEAHPKFLLSEEGLLFRPWNIGHPALAGFPKTIILYARKPAELIVSWAAENAKPYNATIPSLDGHKGPMSIEEGIELLSRIYEEAIWRFISYAAGAEDRLDAVLQIYSNETADSEAFLSNFLNCLGLNSVDVLGDPAFKKQGIVNKGHSRKFCDISVLAWQALGRPSDMAIYNQSLIENLTAVYPGGDDRPVIETVSDGLIECLTKRFRFWENFLADRFLGGAAVFASSYPDCFGLARRSYEPIDQNHFRSFLRQNMA